MTSSEATTEPQCSVKPPEHGDFSLLGEMACCAFCGMASKSGEHVRVCEDPEEGGSSFWACEDGHACAARLDGEHVGHLGAFIGSLS